MQLSLKPLLSNFFPTHGPFFSLGAFPHQIYTFALRLLFLGSGLFGCFQGLAGSLRLPKCDSPARVSFFVGGNITGIDHCSRFLASGHSILGLCLVSIYFITRFLDYCLSLDRLD